MRVTDLSDFETVMYGITPDPLYMIATSEHPLTSMYMDEVIEPSLLPIKMVGVGHVSVEKLEHTVFQTVAYGEFTSLRRLSR